MVCQEPQTGVCHKSTLPIPNETDECDSRSSCKVVSYLSSIDKVIPRILATAAEMGGMPIGIEEWAPRSRFTCTLPPKKKPYASPRTLGPPGISDQQEATKSFAGGKMCYLSSITLSGSDPSRSTLDALHTFSISQYHQMEKPFAEKRWFNVQIQYLVVPTEAGLVRTFILHQGATINDLGLVRGFLSRLYSLLGLDKLFEDIETCAQVVARPTSCSFHWQL